MVGFNSGAIHQHFHATAFINGRCPNAYPIDLVIVLLIGKFFSYSLAFHVFHTSKLSYTIKFLPNKLKILAASMLIRYLLGYNWWINCLRPSYASVMSYNKKKNLISCFTVNSPLYRDFHGRIYQMDGIYLPNGLTDLILIYDFL